MATLEHPFKPTIERLRAAIQTGTPDLSEHVKWNAPSFVYAGEDRVTFRLQPRGICQLVFHRGAKVRSDAQDFAFEDDTGLLEWKTTDRATITFADIADATAKEAAVVALVNRWVVA